MDKRFNIHDWQAKQKLSENEDKSLEQNIESEIKSAISTAEDEEDKSNTISSIFYT